MADSALQIGAGGEGGHLDPKIRRGRSKKFFSALRASVWSKNRGGGAGGPPPDPPLELHFVPVITF